MADTTLFDAYVPLLQAALDSLDAILTKAETHAKENGIDANAEYINARIYEDMRPLAFQVQVIGNQISGLAVPVAGTATPPFASEDKTFADLRTRVQQTRAAFQELKPEHVNGKGEEEFDFKLRRTKLSTMLILIVIPNVFFHLTTTYDILRMKGVPLGKMDYLAPFLASA